MSTAVRAALLGACALAVSGCATKIHDKNATIQPSTVRFANFSHVIVRR